MKATEALALNSLIADWRIEATVVHERPHAATNAPAHVTEAATIERCALELELLLVRLMQEDLADRKAYGGSDESAAVAVCKRFQTWREQMEADAETNPDGAYISGADMLDWFCDVYPIAKMALGE